MPRDNSVQFKAPPFDQLSGYGDLGTTRSAAAFSSRTADEIADARADWEARRRFREVRAYQGPRLDAPSLTKLGRPNPVS